MDVRLARGHVRLDADAEVELGRAYAIGLLSARGRHRVVRVAQTIADLAGHARVRRDDVLMALSLRQRTGAEAAHQAVS
jgi:magnesium chelatase family protein